MVEGAPFERDTYEAREPKLVAEVLRRPRPTSTASASSTNTGVTPACPTFS